MNELSKMFNNSTKKHPFRKSGYRKEIHTLKKLRNVYMETIIYGKIPDS